MQLRTGRTKNLLQASLDSALLAVEIYNKPRTTFRCQSYISLMVIAWTYLFHAHFNKTIGDKYYYKEKNRWKRFDGDKMAWELSTCIDKYNALTEPVKANLKFFIGLRNKIEHRFPGNREFDTSIFGECQSLLYNYETILKQLFGDSYELNTHLVFSLQFSLFRNPEQVQANRRALTRESTNLKEYIDNYRTGLAQPIFDSQEYSIKLISIPKVSNTNRGDIAIEFVKWNDLNDADREKYTKIDALIKDRVVVREAINAGRLKAGNVARKYEEKTGEKLSSYTHLALYSILGIRPRSSSIDKTITNSKYCHYDELHDDYGYEQHWVDLLVNAFQSGKLTRDIVVQTFKKGEHLNIQDYE
jgi:hypothetical protein